MVEGLVLGSVSKSLFDEDFYLRQGSNELKMWPFREFNPRMVCAGEYRVIKKIENPLAPTNYPTTMEIAFDFKTHD